MDNQAPIGLTPAEDAVFKHQARRVQPYKNVSENGGHFYIPDHAEYIEGKGSYAYYRNYVQTPGDCGDKQNPVFPQKNACTDEEVYATNTPKRNLKVLMEFLTAKESRPFFFLFALGTKRWKAKVITNGCKRFIDASIPTMGIFYLKEGYYSEVVTELRKGIEVLLKGFGVDEQTARGTSEPIGCMFEWDWAYRWPLQDILGETTKEKLIENLPQELERLIIILQARDNTATVTSKFSTGVKFIKLLWWIPRYRDIFIEAIQAMDLSKMVLDEGEIYHGILYSQYNMKGRNLEERLKLYETYHGTDRSKWPPRVSVAPRQ